MDDRLVFVSESQRVWVAATERTGIDPPVWIGEISDDRETAPAWRRLERPLSHFLVSFVLQELMYGSEFVAVAPTVLTRFEEAGLSIEPVWIRGEYAWEGLWPSFFLADGRILVRQEPNFEVSGEDWYGCEEAAGADLLRSLGLPTKIP